MADAMRPAAVGAHVAHTVSICSTRPVITPCLKKSKSLLFFE